MIIAEEAGTTYGKLGNELSLVNMSLYDKEVFRWIGKGLTSVPQTPQMSTEESVLVQKVRKKADLPLRRTSSSPTVGTGTFRISNSRG